MNKNLLRFLFISTIGLATSSASIAQKHTINVTDFTVRAKEQKVIINWKTDGAYATNYFAVQKSTDGINYKTVALVLGPDPKLKNSDCYDYADKNVAKNVKVSYRLVHVDTEGNEQITDTKLLARS